MSSLFVDRGRWRAFSRHVSRNSLYKGSAIGLFFRRARFLSATLLGVLLASTSVKAQSLTVTGPSEASRCDTVSITSRFVVSGGTLTALVITQSLSRPSFTYVPSNTVITLPDSSTLTNTAAEPTFNDGGSNLVWDFATELTNVLISEVFYNPTNASESAFEWIEIHNPATNDITLTGWSIIDDVGGASDVLPAMTLAADEFVIIAGSSASFLSENPGYLGQVFQVADGNLGNGLSNGGDGITLRDGGLNAVDAVSYGSASGAGFSVTAVAEGSTIERNPANKDNNRAGDWFGNSAPDPGDGSLLKLVSASTITNLLISEVFYDSSSAPEEGFEWFEIYNPSPNVITMENWFVEDDLPGQRDLLTNAIIVVNPGEFVVIAGNTNDFLTDNPTYMGQLFQVDDGDIGSGLNDFADGITLYDANSNVVDAVSYGSSSKAGFSAPDVATDRSLGRNPVTDDTDSAGDWADQAAPDPGEGSFAVGGLDNGSIVTIVFDAEVGCDGIGGQFIARAGFEQPPGVPDTEAGALFVTVNVGDLTIQKTPFVQKAGLGDEVVWDIEIRNEGFGDADNVAVFDNRGSGITFLSASHAPTGGFGSTQLVWDATVPGLGALASMTSGAEVVITVTGVVSSCDDLVNGAFAQWGCTGLVAATNEICEDQSENGELFGVGVSFVPRFPDLSYSIDPPSILNVDYCSGVDVTIHITNAMGTNVGPALGMVYNSAPPTGFEFTGPSVTTNQIAIGNVPVGSSTSVTINLSPVFGVCPVADQQQNFQMVPDYVDPCSVPFGIPLIPVGIIVTGRPEAAISKFIPSSITEADAGFTVQVFYAYQNFLNTTVEIIDVHADYSVDTNVFISGITAGGVDNGTSIIWTQVFSGSGVFTGEFFATFGEPCSSDDGLFTNGLAATPFTDCNGCIQTVQGDGESFFLSIDSAICGSGGGACSFDGFKEKSKDIVEVCEPVTLTHTFTNINGGTVPGSWAGVTFTNLIISGQADTDTNSFSVSIDSSNLTSFVTVSGTNPVVVDLSGLDLSSFPSPASVLTNLVISWDVVSTNSGSVSDFSALQLPPCGEIREVESWNVGQSSMDITLAPLENLEACGITTGRIDLAFLADPILPSGSNSFFPGYDVDVVLNLDASEQGFSSFIFVTNSTLLTNIIGTTGSALTTNDITVTMTDTQVVWSLGNIQTNGFSVTNGGTLIYEIRALCSLGGADTHVAELRYNNRCTTNQTPQFLSARTASNAVSFLPSSRINNSIEPGSQFLDGTTIVYEISFLNSGPGTAYNLRPELTSDTNITFQGASIAPSFISATSVVWDFQSVLGGDDLTDRDNDGFLDDLPSAGQLIIFVTNNVGACSSSQLVLRTDSGCLGTICDATGTDTGAFVTIAGGLVTRAVFPGAAVLCKSNTVQYEVRNSGLVLDYDVTVDMLIPTGMTFVTGSAFYTLNGGPSNTLADPTILGQTFTYSTNEIPEFTVLNPKDTILINYQVYVDCESAFEDTTFRAQGTFRDNCSIQVTNSEVATVLLVDDPQLRVVKEARNETLGTAFSTAQLVADLNQVVTYRLTIDHDPASDNDVQVMELTDTLPANLIITNPANVSPAADAIITNAGQQVLIWSNATLMAQAGGGAPPYTNGAPAFELYITGVVVDCFISNNVAQIAYGCSESCVSITNSTTHSLKTRSDAAVGVNQSLVFDTCGGDYVLTFTNLGSTATGMILTTYAPTGYVFVSATSTGELNSSGLLFSSGNIVTVDLSTAASSGATDVDDDAIDGLANLDFGIAGTFQIRFAFASDGTTLDCAADPTDLDFEDPELADQRSLPASFLLDYNNLCGETQMTSNNASALFAAPDPDIDIQPTTSILVSDGQTITNFVVTIINDTEFGDASNLHARIRFGAAWTNIVIASTNIIHSGTMTNIVTEVQQGTNVLIDLGDVVLDAIDDEIVFTFEATARENAGSLMVLAEVVGDCENTNIINCTYTNTLGEGPLVESMEGAVVGAVTGQYYAFDQDAVFAAGYEISKRVRLATEAAPGGTNRDARIGEDLIYRIEAHFFGADFSNTVIQESLPLNMDFTTNAFTDVGSSPNVSNLWSYAGTNFTLPTPLTNHPTIFVVELPVVVTNALLNQGENSLATFATNVADAIFSVNGVTNDPPADTNVVDIVEPNLFVTKTVNSNLVQAGDVVIFTNRLTHSADSTTNAYDLVFSDVLPNGFTFSGLDLGTDGIDNDDDGIADGADAADETSLVKSDTSIIISFTNNAAMTNMALADSFTLVFPALVSNQLVGATVTNNAVVEFTSLNGPDTNGSERTGADGPGGLNNLESNGVVTITSLSIESINKVFIGSSQTNTIDPDVTIGERMVYRISVTVPQGVVSNAAIRDFVPPGLDWVGSNPDLSLAFPGLGYLFVVPTNITMATNVAAGLVITDPDPTPASSLTIDGSGDDITFTIGNITNAVDTSTDTFDLFMEFVVLDDPVNDGILPGITTNANAVQVTDVFSTLGATSPVYSIAEHDIRISKNFDVATVDAGDVATITLVISNRQQALANAYDVVVEDFLDIDHYVQVSYMDLVTPDGWTSSVSFSVAGTTHRLETTNTTALVPGQSVTSIFSIAIAPNVQPNELFTNVANVTESDTIYGTEPPGIPDRDDTASDSDILAVPNLIAAKLFDNTSETNNPPDSTNRFTQIGEVVNYRISVTLPETTITNLNILDSIPSGMSYVRNSATVDVSSFTGNVLPPLTELPPGPGLLAGDGTNMNFVFLGTTLVAPDNTPTNDTFLIYFDALVLDTNTNIGLGATPTVHTNTASITYLGNPSNPVNAGTVETTVIEPQLGVFKDIIQTNVDAGDQVDITLTLTNSGTATAYDVQAVDPLDTLFFDTSSIVTGTVPTGFVFVASNDAIYVRSDPAEQTFTNTLEAGESLVFTFQVDMAASLPPNATVTNVITLTGDSLMDTNLFDVQRSTAATGSDTIVAGDFVLNKTLFATSETGPVDSTNTFVQIGEIVTYQLETFLPEGTISNLVFTDLLPVGMAHVVGSVVVDTNSLDGTLAPITNIVPNVGLLGGNGQDITVTFLGDTVVNNDNDPSDNTLRIRLSAVVLDTNSNSGLPPQTILTNRATITYSGNPSPPVTSGVVTVTAIEPVVTIFKNIDITSGDAGDQAEVTLVVSNSGTATAYDLLIEDVVNGQMFDITSITNVPLSAGYVFSVVTNLPDATVVYESDTNATQAARSLEVGEFVLFRFEVSLAQAVEPNQLLTNRAVVTNADTIDGTPPLGNDRNVGGDEDDDDLTVPGLDIAKALQSTSANGPADTAGSDVTIGEVATYRLTVTLPESTITNLQIVDFVPAGMAFVTNLPADVSGFGGTLPTLSPASSTVGGSGDDVTFVFNGNTVVSNDNNAGNNDFTIDVQLLTLDLVGNVGLPGSQTMLTNQASVTYSSNPSPPTNSGPVVVDVVEPRLSIDKVMTGPSNDLVSINLTVTNSGLSTAFDVAIDDLFPTNWWDTATITGSVPVGFVFNVLGTPGDATLRILSDTNIVPPLNSIEVGESITFSFTAFITNGAFGPITNTATVTTNTTLNGFDPNERDEPDTNDTELLALPGFAMTKTLTSPLGRPAVPGETVTFSISVTNNGQIDLDPVRIDDTFDTSFLSFSSATPNEDFTGAGSIVWSNVGALTVGSETTLVVNFTAVASTQPGDTTNAAVASPVNTTNGLPLPPETNEAPVEITTVGYDLIKTLVSPTGRAAIVGETITFSLTIVNTAEVTLATVPVQDDYETAFLTYAGSAVPPTDDALDDGILNWADVGPVPAGASTTLVLNFTAAMSSTSALRTNVVSTAPTTPPGQPGVPPKTNDAPYEISSSGYTLTKTLTSPIGRAAEIGETISFDLTIANTGDVTLVTVPVEDIYETAFLTYSGSALPPTDDALNDGMLNWSDVGPIPVGSSTTLVLNFTAATTSTSAPRTNVVSTAPTVPADEPPVPELTNDAPYEISSSGYTLTKTRTTPIGRAAEIGEAISFDLVIVNTGDVTLVTVPVIDTYETAFLTYSGSAVPPTDDALNDGMLNWADVGPLPGGATTTLVLNFTAASTSTSAPRTNVVSTAPTVPGDEPPVPELTNDAPYEISSAGYVLTKTLLSPTGRAAQVSETVQFELRIVNTGDVQLTTVPVDDVFDANHLSYVSAVPPEDSTGVGTITWNDIGPLAGGATTSVFVDFTAILSTTSAPLTNVVSTVPTTPPDEPNVPPQTNEAPYEISDSGYTLTKTRTSPLGRAAEIGETVSFDLTIVNNGDVDLVTVPVVDTYETAFLTYSGSAVPPTDDAINDGMLNWTDVGPVPAGASTTLVLNFAANMTSTGAPRTNVVSTAPTVPPAEPPVPPQTNDAPYAVSSAGYTLTKTRTSPIGRAAQVGETVSFDLVIVNTGDVTLVTVPVVDTYETAFLTYSGSAVPPTDDALNDGVLNWANVGPLSGGATTTLVLNFSAAMTSTSAPRTNVVSTTPTTPPDEPNVPPETNDAPYEVSSAGYEILKTLISPTGRPAQVGETITFDVLITNTGDVTLVTVPVEDVYETNFLTYAGVAVPASDDAIDDGIINWADIGPLAVGASTNIVIDFTGTFSTTNLPRTNVVSTAPTTPPDEPNVPELTNGAPYVIGSQGYSLTKTRTIPASRPAVVGESVQFLITINNTGEVDIVTLPVSDVFDPTFITFTSAVPAESSSGAGSISWADIGPLPSGSATTIVVNFEAIDTTLLSDETNTVSTAPTPPLTFPPFDELTNEAPYQVTTIGYTLAKQVIAPTNRPAVIGEPIDFVITIVNTGEVQLATIPLVDTYSTTFLTYTGATPGSVDNVNDGVINWSNVGPLNSGASTTVVVHFTATLSTPAPQNNTVFASPTTPPTYPDPPSDLDNAPYEITTVGYTLNKTRTSPAGRAAQEGEAVSFDITIVNTGEVDLAIVPVLDTYDPAHLFFTNAVPVEDVDIPGTISWTNVGPLSAGASTTLVIHYQALLSTTSTPLTNVVETSPFTATNQPQVDPMTSGAPYEISRAGYDIFKTLISPTGRPAIITEAVQFEVLIVNTGDVDLVTVPVEDTYDTTYISFTNAVPATDDLVDDGTINWADVGPLPVGASTTLLVQFLAVETTFTTPETNNVRTTPTTPPTEPPVPPKSNEAPYLVDLPATIGDFVWNDLNANGIQEVGDTGVVGVLVELYDGMLNLIATTNTDTAGFYVFTNLIPGDYFVDVAPPAAYFTSPQNVGGDDSLDSDIDLITGETAITNLAAGETNLTHDAGIYLPASLGDFVWDDVNGNGIFDGGEPAVTGVVVTLYDAMTNPVNTTTTDIAGAYAFTNLTPGTYFVGFTPPENYQFTLQNQGADDTIDSDADILTGYTEPTVLISGENDPTWDAGLYQPATIGDFVWNDLDADGIQDGGETGVVGVTVQLFDGMTNLIATTNTDTTGFYIFTNLPPTNYFVGISTPAAYFISPQDQGGDDGLDSDVNPSTGVTSITNLMSAETNLTLDAGIYLPASLGDFVWDDIDGNGIQDGGEPGIPGVLVTLYDAMTNALDTTNTTGTGFYEFTNLVPNTYFVGFDLPANYQFTLLNQGVDDTVDSDADTLTGYTATTTLISDQRDPTLDAGMYQPATLGDFVWNDLNADGLQDPGETGIVSVLVQLFDGGGNFIASTNTDATGFYIFTNLPPTNYLVDVTPPAGYFISPQNTGGDDTIDSDIDLVFGQSALTNLLSAETNLTLDAGLYLPASIGNFVWEDVNGNGIQDGGEPGLQNVLVTLYDAMTNALDTTNTSASGFYEFTNLVPSAYLVGFDLLPNYQFTLQHQGADDTVDSDADVATGYAEVTALISGENDTTWDAGMYQPATLGDFVWNDLNADGIQDGGETGVVGVTVRLFDGGGNLISTTNTDTTGFYIFTNLPPTNYIALVTIPAGYAVSPQNVGGDDTIDSDIDVIGQTALTNLVSAQTNLTLDAGIYLPASLGDFVWDDIDGNGVQDGGEPGIPGVLVTLYDAMTNALDTTNTTGTGFYEFTNLVPNTYFVGFDLPVNYQFTLLNQGVDDTIDSDADTLTGYTATTTLISDQRDPTLDAGMYQPATLGDFVWNDLNADGLQDPGETGIVSVLVQLFDGGGNFIASTNTDTTGFYIFTNLPPTNYLVDVIPPAGYFISPQNVGGDDTLDSDINLATGETALTNLVSAQTNLTLDAGLYLPASIGDYVWEDINGNGIQELGEPYLANVTVTLYNSMTNPIRTTNTSIMGFYEFTNLVPNTYLVGFDLLPNYQFTLQDQGGDDMLDSDADQLTGLTVPTVLISGEDDLTWDAGMYRPATLGDYVWHDLNADGIQDGGETGVVNVTVSLLTNGTVVATTNTDASGNYEFTNLVPGVSYTVVFTNLPSNFYFSPQDQGGDDMLDSDADVLTGQAVSTVLTSAQVNLTFDAGIFTPGTLGDFIWNDLNGDGIQDVGEPGVFNATLTLFNSNGVAVAVTNTDVSGMYLFTNLFPGSFSLELSPPVGYQITPQNIGGDTLDSDFDVSSGLTTDPNILISQENDLTWDGGLYLPASLAGTIYHDQNDDGAQQLSEVPFGNIQVVLFDNNSGLAIATNSTDLNGDYLFSGIPPGDYYVDVVDATVPPGFDLASSFTDPSIVYTLTSGEHQPDVDFAYLNNDPFTAIIGDYVWSDTDADGIQDPGESGIGGVTVCLLTAGIDGVFGTSNDVTNATTVTTSAGFYLFSGLATGQYVVVVKDGSNTVLEALTSVDGPQSFPGITTPITLNPGDAFLGADFGYTGLTGEIGNQVFLDVNTNGTFDVGDSGIPGVTINLVDSNGLIVATTTTDENGQYLFTGLQGGDYTVDVSDIDSVLTGLVQTFGTPNTNDEGQVDPITVTLPDGGSIDYADFGYGPQVGTLGNLVFNDVNADGVFDPADGDVGIPGVEVILYDSFSNPIATNTTGLGGLYLFLSVPPETYLVGVDNSTLPPGFGVGPLGTPGLDNNSQGQLYSVTLGPGESDLTSDFGYIGTGSIVIGDTVYFDWNNNGTYDPMRDTPIAGIDLCLYIDLDSDGIIDTNDTLIGTDTTDTNGNYLFTGLIPTNYIVDLKDPLFQLVNTTQTEGNDPEAVDVTDGLDDLDVDFGFYPNVPVATLGDIVWVDENQNAMHTDEDLTTILGLNDVTVRLFEVSGNVTTFVGATKSGPGPGGINGYYQFPGLPYGDYFVEVDQSTIPSGLTIQTTPQAYIVTLGPNGQDQNSDFGYMFVPTAVELRYLRASRVADGVLVEWATAVEFENLGFNVYRSESVDGVRTKINSSFILGLGSSVGQSYDITDLTASQDAVYYYWLEDLDWHGVSTINGPATVGVADEELEGTETLADFTVAAEPGVYRITYEVLMAAGVPVDSINPADLQVVVDGSEVAISVMSFGAVMAEGDYILFYAANAGQERHCEIRLAPDGLRMDYSYVAPMDGEGDTWIGSAPEEQSMSFVVTDAYARYMLFGFEGAYAWLFDVTQSSTPSILFGYAYLTVEGDSAIYLSYPGVSSATCFAVSDESIIEIEFVERRE